MLLLDQEKRIWTEDSWEQILVPSTVSTNIWSRTLSVTISSGSYSDLGLDRTSLSTSYKRPCYIPCAKECA